MSLNSVIQRQVAQAFTRILKPGELTETVTFKYFVADGAFDVANDVKEPTWNIHAGVVCVVAKPADDDLKRGDVVVSDAKLVIPGLFLPGEPNVETDIVIRADGSQWNIRKAVGVPGGSLWLIYIFET